MSLTGQQFDAVFDGFVTSPTSTRVFRLEAYQHYHVPSDDPFMAAFRNREPRPSRSVRTSPWLARVANSVISGGKQWQRVHLIREPLSEYLQMEMQGYVESQAAGEEIFLADADGPTLSSLGPDFWLFDDPAHVGGGYAVLMHYDQAGQPQSFEFVDDAGRLDALRVQRDTAMERSVDLNEFLAHDTLVIGVPAARAAS
jgi:hypothetical protein